MILCKCILWWSPFAGRNKTLRAYRFVSLIALLEIHIVRKSPMVQSGNRNIACHVRWNLFLLQYSFCMYSIQFLLLLPVQI